MILYRSNRGAFYHLYLLTFILPGFYFQCAWATHKLDSPPTESVFGRKPTASPKLDKTSVHPNESLGCIPNFDDKDGDQEDSSILSWQVQDNAGGPWRALPEYTGPTINNVWRGYAGRMLRCLVQPKTNAAITDPYIGDEVYSSPISVVGNKPEAKDVKITGETTVEKILTGQYIYSDSDGDVEDISELQWLRDGAPIPEAKNKEKYTIQSSDQGHSLSFTVTPKAKGPGLPIIGDTYTSSPSAIVTGRAPVASDVHLEHIRVGHSTTTYMMGDTLNLKYKYTDADGDLEGTSVITWTRNGSEILAAHNKKSYTLTKDDLSAMFSVKIVPVSQTGTPNKGTYVQLKSVKVSMWYKGFKVGNFESGINFCKSLGQNITMPSIPAAATLARDTKLADEWMGLKADPSHEWINTSENVPGTVNFWQIKRIYGTKREENKVTANQIISCAREVD